MANEMEDLNCPVVADVDFGLGPTKIRCTETGDHDEHKCEVKINVEAAVAEHRNVFDDPTQVPGEAL